MGTCGERMCIARGVAKAMSLRWLWLLLCPVPVWCASELCMWLVENINAGSSSGSSMSSWLDTSSASHKCESGDDDRESLPMDT